MHIQKYWRRLRRLGLFPKQCLSNLTMDLLARYLNIVYGQPQTSLSMQQGRLNLAPRGYDNPPFPSTPSHWEDDHKCNRNACEYLYSFHQWLLDMYNLTSIMIGSTRVLVNMCVGKIRVSINVTIYPKVDLFHNLIVSKYISKLLKYSWVHLLWDLSILCFYKISSLPN